MAEAKRFLRFCGVGMVGFMVDAGLTLASMGLVPPMLGRIPAFLTASLVTYTLNRRLTFGHNGHFLKGWLHYLMAGIVGVLLNYAAYAATLAAFGTSQIVALLGIALGSAIGLAFNYWASSRLVFRTTGRS